ncbi:MAG: diguanylate cyclase, partial [Acidimicrobiales bacterium]
ALPTRIVVEAAQGAPGVAAPARERRGRRGSANVSGPPPDEGAGPHRLAARDRAHWLVKELQDCVPGAAAEVIALLGRARTEGWPEVLRAALYADAVAALVANDGRLREAVTTLRQQAELDGEPVMEALALALGSWDQLAGGHPEAAVAADADLARATVLLELAEDLDRYNRYERASAHIAAAVSYGYRRLWELEDEQYQLAERVLVRGEEKFLRAVVLFNRAELQMKWACALREIDEQEEVGRHCRLGSQAVGVALQQADLPHTWRSGLAVVDLMFAALSGKSVADDARRLPADELYYEFAAHLPLAEALADASHGRRRSSMEKASRALAALGPATRPEEYDLALFLWAEQNETAKGGPSPALRYAKRQARLRWQSRLSALASMRSLLRGERLRGEHALFRRHAFFDDLTGLANRRELHRFLGLLATKGAGRVTLMLCDIDNFKRVNDRFGHLVGDMVLVEVASLLSASVRSADLAARLGGDEFVLVLDKVDLGSAEVRASAIVRDLAERSLSHAPPGLKVRLSIGVAGGHAGQAEELLRRADVGLYQAKAAGGSRCVAVR